MSFLCKMRGVIDSCKSSLFGLLPPQLRVLTSWTALFLYFAFLGCSRSFFSLVEPDKLQRKATPQDTFVRAAFKGHLPLIDAVRNCPQSGIIFCTWFVQGKLCRGSNGKSFCLYHLRNSPFDLLVPKTPVKYNLNVTFSYRVSQLDFEHLFCPDQQYSLVFPDQKGGTGCQFTVSFIVI